MAVPKKKTSRSKRNMRRAHDAIKFTEAIEYCPDCGEPKLRHRLCTACGTYRGRQVIAGAAPVVDDGGFEAPAGE